MIPELDVSGGTPLEDREGLREAVELIEAGKAQVLVAAYFDRLVRSLRVQDELVTRVEKKGGQVLAVDVGRVTNGSAGQWLSGTMLGAVSEYQRRTTAERTHEAQAAAIARGVAPWPNIIPGYLRGPDGVLVPDPETKDAVVEAFELRADGASWSTIRDHLREHGVERSIHGVGSLLASRVVLGEIHFGDFEPNLKAHDYIVDRGLWQAAQRRHVARGRKPKSDRLMARLGVLRCGTCSSRMIVASQRQASGRRFAFYRCGNPDCPARVTIGADKVEKIVTDAVRERLADMEGRASAESGIREAEDRLEAAQSDLDAALRAFAGFEDEAAARDRLVELREARDAAQDEVDQVSGVHAVETVLVDRDWDRLSFAGRRDLIRVTVERVEVRPGRGPDRVTVTMRGEGR